MSEKEPLSHVSEILARWATRLPENKREDALYFVGSLVFIRNSVPMDDQAGQVLDGCIQRTLDLDDVGAIVEALDNLKSSIARALERSNYLAQRIGSYCQKCGVEKKGLLLINTPKGTAYICEDCIGASTEKNQEKSN